jgi:hypothetical protein
MPPQDSDYPSNPALTQLSFAFTLSPVTASPADFIAIVSHKHYRDPVLPAIHSWTVFLVTVEYFQEESPCKLPLLFCGSLERETYV